MNAPLLDAPKFETGRSDPRLAECLKEFPPAIFSERLYQSIELMERYSIELAVDLLGQLNLAEQLGAWRSADELCSVLGFQPRFRLRLTLDPNAPGRNRLRRGAKRRRDSVLSLAEDAMATRSQMLARARAQH